MKKHPYTVLAVDDDNVTLKFFQQVLGVHYNLYVAASAMLMFDVLTSIEAMSKPLPDLIILDVVMPDMNGYEAARLLKKHDKYKNIPIIFVTSDRCEISRAQGMQIGAADYIYKPFIKEQLLMRIQSLIDINILEKKLEKERRQ